MKLYKYNQFLNADVLNENLDKAKKYLKERYLLLTAATELNLLKGELGEQIKHKEIKSVRLIDFTPEEREEIKTKLRDMKVTPEVLKTLDKSEEFVKVRTLQTIISTPKGQKTYQLDRDNIGWLSIFTYFYYFENIPLEELSTIYRRLIQNKDILNNLTIEEGKDNFVKKVFDPNFINEDITNNSERLTDGLDRLESSRKIKRMYDTLTPELKASYDTTSDLNKEKFLSLSVGFEELGKKADGTVDEEKKKKIWSEFFGKMSPDTRPLLEDGKTPNPNFSKLVYQSTLKRYKTIHEFIIAANGHLNSYEMDGFEVFSELIDKCNKKLGVSGVEKVFNENGILILEVHSFAANQIVNAHTSHCIKDTLSQWNSYVENHNNKQYYIYDFHVPLRDNYSTIGITIEPGQKVRACHNRPDHSLGVQEFKNLLKKWETAYNIDKDLWSYFLPMDNEEIRKKEKAKEANRKIVEPGLSKEKIIEYVTEYGADINKDNCKALWNAVKEDDYEKTDLILKLGGLPNLAKKKEAAISQAANIKMIHLLIDNGAEMTGDVFRSVVNEKEALHYCLNAGLDPAFEHSLPLRACIKGTYEDGRTAGKPANKPGEPFYESFLILMKYMERNSNLLNILYHGNNMASKWAVDYGRLDIIDYFKGLGLYDKFTTRDWDDLVGPKDEPDSRRGWVNISRMNDDTVKQKTKEHFRKIRQETGK